MIHFQTSVQAGSGDLDKSFDPASGVNGGIYCVAAQADGKIIIGGEFSTVRGAVRSGVARLNADGTVDRTFDPGSGVVFGSRKPPFITNWVESAGVVYAVALQSDGKLLIGGQFQVVNGISRNRIARLNTDGSLDTSFDPGTGASNTVYAVVVQSDGKVLIGGSFTNVNGVSRSGIARLNSDGSVDASFDPVVAGSETDTINVDAIAVQPDGKVLIGGTFTNISGTSRNSIARLNANGSLDVTFDPGTGVGDVFLYRSVRALNLQPDGKVVLVGSFTSINGVSRNRVARLNVDGSLDGSFDPGTVAQGNGVLLNPGVTSVALQSDGKILIGGQFDSVNGTNRNHIARLNSDGSLDGTFDPGTGADGEVSCVALQADGRVLLVGTFLAINGASQNYVGRLLADGGVDGTFRPGIRSALPEDVSCVALQPDGKVILGVANSIVSYFDWPFSNTVVRLNNDGSLDDTFQIGSGLDEQVNAVAVQADGKILIGGLFTMVNGVGREYLARLNTNGSLDLTFQAGTGPNGNVNCIVVQPDAKVLIAGGFTEFDGISRNRFARLHPDGTLDAAFDPGANMDGGPSRIVVQPDSKIVISGGFTSIEGTPRNRIARLNADGSLDSSFEPGIGPNAAIGSIALQGDGRILVGGDFSSFSGASRKFIARLNSDGSLDTTFNPGNWIAPNFFGSHVYAVALLWNGKVLIGGDFSITNGIIARNIVRLNPDGSLDRAFLPARFTVGEWSGGGYVYCMAVQPDGRVLIGGNFGLIGGVIRERIARLWGDGANVVSGPVIENGEFVARYGGIPGITYTLEHSTTLSPANWQKTTNRIAPTNDAGYGIGVFELREAIVPPGHGFYRVVYPAY